MQLRDVLGVKFGERRIVRAGLVALIERPFDGMIGGENRETKQELKKGTDRSVHGRS
jgi:hypothetical protein